MPALNLYIPKDADERWRTLPQERRDEIAAALRSLLRRKLAQVTTEEASPVRA